MKKTQIIVAPNHFIYQDKKVYYLHLEVVDNQATAYLYCKNNETVSRAVYMDKTQLEGLCKIKEVMTLRQRTVIDIAPILEAHNWQVLPNN
ncbi:hypothetical protein [Dapis sp. BLCC M172]|uniref:hypothetical protein n=1 Tax=Dapis sp. BLCC M172 TaxID=2975281 RepID=UPI003CEFEFC8